MRVSEFDTSTTPTRRSVIADNCDLSKLRSIGNSERYPSYELISDILEKASAISGDSGLEKSTSDYQTNRG